MLISATLAQELLGKHPAILDESFFCEFGFVLFCRTAGKWFRKRSLWVPKKLLVEANAVAEAAEKETAEKVEAALALLKLERQRFVRVANEESTEEILYRLYRDGQESRGPRRLIVLATGVAIEEAINEFVRHNLPLKRRPGCIALLRWNCLRGTGELTEPWSAAKWPRRSQPWWKWFFGFFRCSPNFGEPFADVKEIVQLDPKAPAQELKLKPELKLVAADGTLWQVGKMRAEGGEAQIYEVICLSRLPHAGHSRLAKLYPAEGLGPTLQKKLQLMTQRRLPDPDICWPEEFLHDAKGQWRGFLMAKAEGTPLKDILAGNKKFRTLDPGWNRRHSVQLAITLLGKIWNLHRLNILLGDINPKNFLVRDEQRVGLVDCDSFQIEGLPCLTFWPEYTHPDFLRKEKGEPEIRNRLREEKHERYAVAVLLFQILLPNQLPYRSVEQIEYRTLAIKGKFPYDPEDKKLDGVPDPLWIRCWSHLSRELKDLFFKAFTISSRNEGVALSCWLSALENYRGILDDPNNVFMSPIRDQYDLALFPLVGWSSQPRRTPENL